MIVADFTVTPMGTGTSASEYVAAIYSLLDESAIKYFPCPMSTAIETESFEELFKLIESVNKGLENMGIKRIITTIHIDYRLDKSISIDSKMSITKKK